MANYKKLLVYIGVMMWTLTVTLVMVYNFFPYKKAFQTVFQNTIGRGRMSVSIEDARIKPSGAGASRVVFGHQAIEGRPLFELEGVKIRWNPVSILRGVLSISSKASAYGGRAAINIDSIPLVVTSRPNLSVNLSGVDLSKYPENRLPWVKGISGTMNGWVKKEVALFAPEQQKGSFHINLTDGEFREVLLKNLPRLILPYKDITVDGRINGDRIDIDRVHINSMGLNIKGRGAIEGNTMGQKIDMRLAYEATDQSAPLQGKGAIIVSGSQWSPDISLIPEGRQ